MERKNASQIQELDDTQLKEIVTRYLKGVNYLLALDDEKTYDIEQMEIKRLAWDELKKQYDKDEISDAKEARSCPVACCGVFDYLKIIR